VIKVCLVDNHELTREGLKRILDDSNEIEVTGEAATGEAFLKMLKRPQWDVVILDISLPSMSGIEVLRYLQRKHPALQVLMLSMYEEDQYCFKALELGAGGYLSKSKAPEELLSAIKKVASGGRYMSSLFAEKMKASLGG